MKKSIIFLLAVTLLLTFSAISADFNGKAFQSPALLQGTDAAAGDKNLYDKAYSLYESGKYYDAHEMFIQSQYGDWERMAKKCVRRWPKNGQTYRDTSQWLQDAKLTFQVEQPKDTAVFIRVFKDDKLLSEVFIGGTDTVSLNVPGNSTYTIKDGVGSEWYGNKDAFGANGAYETMTFGEHEEETIYLMARYSYTITINVDNVIGEDVGSQDEEWQNFTK